MGRFYLASDKNLSKYEQSVIKDAQERGRKVLDSIKFGKTATITSSEERIYLSLTLARGESRYKVAHRAADAIRALSRFNNPTGIKGLFVYPGGLGGATYADRPTTTLHLTVAGDIVSERRSFGDYGSFTEKRYNEMTRAEKAKVAVRRRKAKLAIAQTLRKMGYSIVKPRARKGARVK